MTLRKNRSMKDLNFAIKASISIQMRDKENGIDNDALDSEFVRY